MRRAHFRVFGRFDGSPGATVTIEGDERSGFLFRVRPRGRRRTFDVPLDVLARGAVYDITIAEIAAKNRAKRATKGA